MPSIPSELTSLHQAVLLLESGRRPVPEAAFKALGPVPLPSEARAYDVFVLAARNGELPLFGNLRVTITTYGVNPPFRMENGAIVEVKVPSETVEYELTHNKKIETEKLSRDQINFETSTISLDSEPTGSPSLPFRLRAHEQATYHFDAVRVPVEPLRSASRKYCNQKMLSGSESEPTWKPTKIHPGHVIAALMKIMLIDGFSNGSVNSLIERVQEKMGDDAPSDSTLKEWFKPAFKDPEVKEYFADLTKNATRINSKQASG